MIIKMQAVFSYLQYTHYVQINISEQEYIIRIPNLWKLLQQPFLHQIHIKDV